MAVTIVELLAVKKSELDALTKQIEHLQAALAAEMGPRATIGKRPPLLQLARVTLQEAKEPTHVKNIAQKIAERDGVHGSTHSLANQLYRASKKGRVFFKDKKRENTYGLIEWQHSRS